MLKKTKITWTDQKDAYKKALAYLDGRRKGEIKSFKTPWQKVNDAGVDGFEWHSMIVIGGRPGTGKTLIKDQIVRESFRLNAGSNMRVLEFQFEMLARASAVREFSSVLNKSYKYVCSAGEGQKLSNDDLRKCYEYAKERVKYPIDIVEKSCTILEFKRIIREYMNTHAIQSTEIVDGNTISKKTYVNTLISVDHSYLFQTTNGDKTAMLYDLGEALTELKREFPIIFIILSQLKREADKPERNEDGKYGNYILDSDILGGDALMQHADIVIGVNRPSQRFIKFYGPDRFLIDDDTTLVFHFLKCRNGDVRMSFFKAEYNRMAVSEMDTPGRQTKNISTKVS